MSDNTKIIVVSGSRGWEDKEIMRIRIKAAQPDLVVQGGAPAGADKFAREICNEEGIKCHTQRAKWERYGKGAGNIRNGEMLSDWDPDEVICFWDGVSPGTKDMINKANVRGYKLQVNL